MMWKIVVSGRESPPVGLVVGVGLGACGSVGVMDIVVGDGDGGVWVWMDVGCRFFFERVIWTQ